ncbi:ABC transporter ATP-binding protein [Streptomyces sp. JJ36]|uniref:ABC transporter ATP-binding protein n=1 Tax=Streptomyces sp. JJ36 TaxID=2736645 RepID=UPI001F4518BB|nr:ABC transporter ATP-binding protein [Streptomyces sp. JJ36]MCF6524644.1 ABC transporter ATP-binding protein [Streptomyces sp. JJ36]
MPARLTAAPGWRLLGDFLRRHRAAAATVAGWSLLEALPALCSGLLVAAAVDRGFLAGDVGTGFAWLGLLGALMLAGAAVTRTLTPRLGHLAEPLRDELVTGVVRGTLGRAAATGVHREDGAAIARVAGQTETVRALVAGLLRSARQLGATLLMALAGLTALAAPVAAIALPAVVLTGLLCVPRLRLLARRRREQLAVEERMTGRAQSAYGGMRDVVACGARNRVEAEVAGCVAEHARATLAVARTTAGTTLLASAGGWLPVLVVLATAPWLLRHGGLTVGALVGAVTYLVTQVEPALRALVRVLGTWGTQLDAVLRSLAAASEEPARTPASGGVPAGPDLHAEELSFAYGPRARPVISRLTLTVPAGGHLAVVGPSGAGKSTLASLVAGLAAPDGGALRIGGVPAHQAERRVLRREVALIPQEAYVFTGTVRDNLRYLCPDADDARLTASLRAVGAGALVNRLGGLDAPVGLDGPELSAGESQLIALARAHASPARLVVLDEACCHLDPAAEATAEEGFAARPGTTLLVIAHRISSALRADRILVLDGERTVTGTHETLLSASPLYAELVGHWRGDPAAPPGPAAPPEARQAPPAPRR